MKMLVRYITKLLMLFLIIRGIGCLAPPDTEAGNRWSLELSGGGAYCVRTPLTIHQSGYQDIEITAQYETHSFQSPFYYSIRVAAWKDTRAWEVELVHLKLELTNRPEEVQRFEISHGYNLLMVNRAWTTPAFILRLGAGVVISHPESTVRGRAFDEHGGIMNAGYYFSGPTLQAAVEKKFYVQQHIFLALEGKVTGSYARVPIADGDADVTSAAIHGLFGLGYEF